jgi:hypothetical protein
MCVLSGRHEPRRVLKLLCAFRGGCCKSHAEEALGVRILLGSVDARKRLMNLVRLEELSEIVRHESAALI